jgi:hypothetical protein
MERVEAHAALRRVDREPLHVGARGGGEGGSDHEGTDGDSEDAWSGHRVEYHGPRWSVN